MIKYKTIILSIAAAIAMAVAPSVSAQGTCVTQYGGSQYGTNCNPNDVVINKEVQRIGARDSNGGPVYVENLSTSDASASAGMFTTFRLTVRNNASVTFNTVEVRDIFPPYMSYPVGTTGTIVGGDVRSSTYNADTRTLTMNLENFRPGESRQIIITARIDDANAFPSGRGMFCVVNTAQVRADNRFDEDTAQVCITQPNVKGVSTLPKAGSESLYIVLASAVVGMIGLKLMRKTA